MAIDVVTFITVMGIGIATCIALIFLHTLFSRKEAKSKDILHKFEEKMLQVKDGTNDKIILELADNRLKDEGARSFYQAKKLYEKAAQTSPEGFLKMGRMYRDGTSEIPPDGLKAIENYMKAFELGGYEDAVLEIASIYSYGLHPYFLPDKVIAGRIFSLVTFDARFSDGAKQYAKHMMKDISNMTYDDIDTIKMKDRTYTLLPTNIVDTMLSVDSPRLLIPSDEHKTHVPSTLGHHGDESSSDDDTDTGSNDTEDIQIQQAMLNEYERLRQTLELGRANVSHVRNDAQNVHDSHLQNAAMANLSIIDSSSPSFQNNLDDIKQIFSSHPKLTATEKTNIGRVLNSLDSVYVHSKYNKTEKQVLESILSRINSDVNRDNKEELIVALGQQLASGVEHGHVVCSTGKIMRMMAALDGLDVGNDLVRLKPKWAIEREIADAAANIRKQVLDESTQEQRDKYETGNGDGLLEEEMKKRLWDKCVDDYVTNGIINNDESMKLLVDPYLESF